MTDRIREIAHTYASNALEVENLYIAISALIRDEREACAKVIDGLMEGVRDLMPDDRPDGIEALRTASLVLRARKP